MKTKQDNIYLCMTRQGISDDFVIVRCKDYHINYLRDGMKDVRQITEDKAEKLSKKANCAGLFDISEEVEAQKAIFWNRYRVRTL